MAKTSLLILCVFLFGFSRCSQAPKPPQVKIYLGDHLEQSICRLNENEEIECVLTNDEAFSNYQCLSIDDVGKLTEYVIDLHESCKGWKK